MEATNNFYTNYKRMLFRAHRTDNSEEMLAFAKSPWAEVRRKLAANYHITEACVDILIRDPSEQVRETLRRENAIGYRRYQNRNAVYLAKPTSEELDDAYKSSSIERLKELASHTSDEVKKGIIYNKDATVEVLEILVTSGVFTQEALYRYFSNPNMSEQALRMAFCSNENDFLRKGPLLSHCDERLILLLCHPNCSDEIRKVISENYRFKLEGMFDKAFWEK